ncbi:MAG: ScpA family protein [Anaerolineae bacterium]|nr:segregation/condensation protein A [Anaerolineae bacterium]MDW8103067.1 ScpA family protein [Anaerolineae bacterium]
METLQRFLKPWLSWPIKLPSFEGPLDLLLYLLEKNQLEITAVSLALVADQFVEFLDRAEGFELEALADFIAIAARLLALKSRYLLPQPPAPSALSPEPEGEELVRQLLLYRAFREKARFLEERELAGLRCYVRASVPVKPQAQLLPPNPFTIEDLRDCARRLLLRERGEEVSTLISPIKVTVKEKMEFIRQKLVEGERRRLFWEFLSDGPHPQEVIVTFMALLELIKLGEVMAWQEGLFGPIYVAKVSGNSTHSV